MNPGKKPSPCGRTRWRKHFDHHEEEEQNADDERTETSKKDDDNDEDGDDQDAEGDDDDDDADGLGGNPRGNQQGAQTTQQKPHQLKEMASPQTKKDRDAEKQHQQIPAKAPKLNNSERIEPGSFGRGAPKVQGEPQGER